MKNKKISKWFSPMRTVPKNPFAFLWEALYGFRSSMFIGILCTFLLSLFKIWTPVFFSEMLGYFAEAKPQNVDWGRIGVYLLLILAVFIAENLMRFVREFVESVYVRNPLRIKLSLWGLRYIAGHSENYLAGQKSGQLAQKILGLKDNCSKLHVFITRMFSCLFLLGLTFFYIGQVSLLFVVITIVVGTVSGYFSYKASYVLKALNKASFNAWNEYKGVVADSIANLITVKMFGVEKQERALVMKYFSKTRDTRLDEVNQAENMLILQRILFAVFKLSGVLLVVYLWYLEEINIGDVALVLMLQDRALENFRRFWSELSNLNRIYGEVSASMMPFLVPYEITDKLNAKELKVQKGAVCFEKVVFAYPKQKNVLQDFELHIKPKEKIGIVGLSGSGKTTLINLLQRFYLPQGGKIMIDGQNINDVTHSSLADNIAVISQENLLFCRTIMQNIGYGNLQATEKQIIQAAEKAQADGFIRNLESGYATKVGERGVKLSGGEKQRIAIARAILKDAPILILDEATSALDNESENKISASLKPLMKGKTVIAIAHRLSTLKQMDRIVVLDNGKIVEQGTPEELWDMGGNFTRLWNLQMQ